MRISVNEDDPGYQNFLDGYTVVFLNGEKIGECFVADEEKGYVERYKVGAYNAFEWDDEKGDFVRERLFGKVEIFKDKDPR